MEKRREVPQDLLDRVRHLSANFGAAAAAAKLPGSSARGSSSRSRRYA